MSKSIKLLGLLFIAQLLALSAIHLSKSASDSYAPTPLLSEQELNASEIVIRGEKGQTEFARSESDWLLPNYGNGLPASTDKFNKLLKSLKQTKVTWPIASTKEAAKRFEVSASNAQKTLVLTQANGKQVTLYLGTSPSYRKLHVRRDDSDDIYVIQLAQHDLPEEAESWLQKDLLSVKGTITSIATEGFSLTKSDDKWTIEGLAEDSVFNADKAAEWVKKFNHIYVNRLVENTDLAQSVIIQSPIFTATASTASGETNFAFYTKEDRWFVKTFGDTPLFEIAKYQAEPMISATSASFVDDISPDKTAHDNQSTAAP